MSGLLRRLTRRRPATADENPSSTTGSSEPVAAPGDAPAEPGGERPVPAEDQPTQQLPATGEQTAAAPSELAPSGQPAATPAEQTSPGAEWAKTAVTPSEPAAPESQPTAFAAQRSPARDLPAGLDPGDLTTAPAASARRGKLRRRLRYLRRVRELLLRDLGGFTYEIHRTAGGTPQESHRKLTAAKTGRIAALDAEVGALEARLGEPHADPVLREAGIGGSCPECGELHASDARYCSRCGTPLDARVRAKRDAAIAAAAAPATATATASHPTPEPQPASVLWAGGPRPSAPTEQAAEEERPSGATGRWLAAQPTTFDHAVRPGEARAAAKADEPAADVPDTKAAEVPETKADEPAADAPDTKADEPAADAPDTKADEPAADAPATTADESTADAPAAKAGEPAPATDDPTPDEAPPAKPKRARASRAKKPPKPRAKPPADDAPFEPGPNGRRDDDVPPPVTSGDPLTSRRERRP